MGTNCFWAFSIDVNSSGIVYLFYVGIITFYIFNKLKIWMVYL